MLIELTFENFKCYRDETTLQMTADALSEHSDTLIPFGKDSLLPVSVIYGPNGGGKSSVLQAFQCLQNHVILPFRLLRRRDISMSAVTCHPYAFDGESEDEPTSFRILFTAGEYTYRYILSVFKDEIEEEYLHRRKTGRGATATLFERKNGEIELGPSLKGKHINRSIDSMMPFLTYLALNHNFDSIDEAFSWFAVCDVLDYSRPMSENRLAVVEDGPEKDDMIEVLNNMGIDITNIRYQRDEEDDLKGVYLTHSASTDRELELAEESNGTKKLLSCLPMILQALDEGSLVVSDELDAKLHPKLLRYVIRLFTDVRTNPNGAQLIFTSHDMTNLDSSVFRRDEIWFAARTAEGPSTLYSLADISDTDGKRVRPQNAYDRQYLSGRYGADPYLRNMLKWRCTDDK